MKPYGSKHRRILSLILTGAFLLTLIPISVRADGTTYTDGVFTGTGAGRNGDITLAVTISGGVITQIEEVEQAETPRYWDKAKALFDVIIAANSTDIDAISGATLSSNGIKAAVNDALAKSLPDLSGAGTADDPFVIRSAAQLRTFAEKVDEGDTAYTGAVVVLGADIDLSGSWNPIGAEGKANANAGRLFTGEFNGQGHVIRGLNIEGTYHEEANLGLFSTLGPDAQIYDVILENVSIHASTDGGFTHIRAGGIAGDTARTSGNRAAVVDGCRTDGAIGLSAADGSAFGGGILGRAFTKAAVINCVSSVTVRIVTEGNFNAAYAGGIAGMTGNNTVLANCAAFGSTAAENLAGNADAYAGGLCGMLASTIYNCYAAGDAGITQKSTAEKQFVGALAGQQAASPAGSMNYYSSSVRLSAADENGTETAVPSRPWSPDDLTGNATAEDPLTAEEMEDPAFCDTLNGNLSAASRALDEDALALREWKWDGSRAVVSSVLWEPVPEGGGLFDSGSGTEEDPWIIRTAEQLKAFALSQSGGANYSGAYIKISDEADVIDLSGENWTPVGGSSYLFDGNFDGNGKTIRGLTEGSAESPLELAAGNSYIGLFGCLDEHARIHDLILDDVLIHTHSAGSAYVGGIAGRMMGSDTEGDYHGAVIDNVEVRGAITHITEKGTSFIGGVCGHMFKGAVINSMTDVTMFGQEKSGELVEVGGFAGLLNRGVIANCYALGDVTGSGMRDVRYDLEGMACVGGIAAVNGGYVVNCLAEGDVTALEYSIDTGVLTGWVTGIAKVYDSWYNEKAVMTIDGRQVTPVDPFGEVVSGGVSDEWGFKFPGSLIEGNMAYVPGEEGASAAADGLNATFAVFPIDIETIYGISGSSLRKWTSDGVRAVFGEGYGQITYVKPQVEIDLEAEEEKEDALLDGEWYGRSPDGSTIVRITVTDGQILKTEVLLGEESGENYENAVIRAAFKARFGDTTDYSEADPGRFSGSGTEADPYRIENEEQLRYLAESIDEDVDWRGAYFLQTADIDMKGRDWTPIGWGIFADADDDGFGQDLVALYPFRGNYDGGNHVIRNLSAGDPGHPASGNWMGLFGVIQGDYDSNEIPEGDVRRAVLKNIRLENVAFYTESKWRDYVGTVVGSAQGGFVIDNCAAEGIIRASSPEDFAYAGGLAGSLMYGLVSNCRTNVDAGAWSGHNYSYTGGMMGISNRATVINSYTLGDVHGDADQTNRAEAAGFVALDGGICINCYARGNVEVVSKYSMYMGGFAGMAASSSEHRQCYYNTDADQTIAGQPVPEKKYAGKFVNESAEAFAQDQTEAFMSSEDFAALLNVNRLAVSDTLAQVREALGADERGSSRYHSVYYSGDGSDLKEWKLMDGIVGFEQDEPIKPEEPEAPEEPDDPAKPDDPEEPFEPGDPDEVHIPVILPPRPVTPADDPAVPVRPADPEKSAKSAEGLVVKTEKNEHGDYAVTALLNGEPLDRIPAGTVVTIPDAGAGNVLAIVGEDGSLTVVPKSVVENGTVRAVLKAPCTVRVIDNGKSFRDIGSHWAKEEIGFAAAHELFAGVTEDTFAPEEP